MRILTITILLLIVFEARCLLPTSSNNTNNVPTIPPDTCVTSDGQKIWKNEMVPAKKGDCYGIRCNSDLQIEEEECKPAIIEKGCYGRSFDFSFLYPDCCPAAVC
ncbi:hypothetical protein Trydic_g22802 [Trypoxylus dichotomus]